MRNRRDTIALMALLLALAALALMLRPRAGDTSAGDTRATTYRSSPAGTRALYLLLRELDLPVEHELDAFSPDAKPGALVVLSPTERPTPREVQALSAWIEAGGTLIYAASARDDGFRDEIGVRFEPLNAPDTLTRSTREQWRGAAAYPVQHRWTSDIDSVRGFRRTFRVDADALRDSVTVLLRAEGGAPTVITFRRGGGRIIAWSDVNALRNELLREGDAAVLFARMAAHATVDGGIIRFDEYHQGYREAGAFVALRRFVSETGLGRGMLQAAVAAIVLLLLAGSRLGAPVVTQKQRRRSPLEHVEAVAAAYRRADARRTSRRLLMAGLERRLNRRIIREDGSITGGALDQSMRAQRLREEWERGAGGDLVALAAAVDDYAGEDRWKQRS